MERATQKNQKHTSAIGDPAGTQTGSVVGAQKSESNICIHIGLQRGAFEQHCKQHKNHRPVACAQAGAQIEGLVISGLEQ